MLMNGIKESKKILDEANFIYVLSMTDENKETGVNMGGWYELLKKLKVKGKVRGKNYTNGVIIDGVVHSFSYRSKYGM